jgi:hypothetical protein
MRVIAAADEAAAAEEEAAGGPDRDYDNPAPDYGDNPPPAVASTED